MLNLHDIVTLKEDDLETGIRKGTEGTVVDIHGNGEAYTVEFFDRDGDTIEASFDKEFTENEIKAAFKRDQFKGNVKEAMEVIKNEQREEDLSLSYPK